MNNPAFTVEELDGQHTAELPARDLMIALTVFGLPLIGISDVSANVSTAGPSWLGSL